MDMDEFLKRWKEIEEREKDELPSVPSFRLPYIGEEIWNDPQKLEEWRSQVRAIEEMREEAENRRKDAEVRRPLPPQPKRASVLLAVDDLPEDQQREVREKLKNVYLTTNHPKSRNGRPVAIIGDEECFHYYNGAAGVFPVSTPYFITVAGHVVVEWAKQPERTEEEKELARRFLEEDIPSC